jgi:acetylornithine deacetylase/succinyl-diaminopimelate desuccinylase-like protein
MPRADNALRLAAEAVARLAAPMPARLTPVMRAFLDGAIATTGGEAQRLLRGLAAGDAGMTDAPPALCSPVYARALEALVRDTISPNVLHGGVKFNVIPGEAVLDIDVRRLPGSTEPAMEALIRERLGPDLAAVTDIDLVIASDAVVAPYDDPDGLFPVLEGVVRDHDPRGAPLPFMLPFGTDAKHLLDLGVPAFGFSPLLQPPGETYLDRYHGVDERVSIDGLRWGLPVLYDAVRRFCG